MAEGNVVNKDEVEWEKLRLNQRYTQKARNF